MGNLIFYIRTSLFLILMLFSYNLYGNIFSGEEEKFFNKKFSKEVKSINKDLRTLNLSPELLKTIEGGLKESLLDKNDYYTNSYLALLFRYYHLNNNLKEAFEVYKQSKNLGVSKSKLSYIDLNLRFYYFFNSYEIDSESKKILEKIKKVISGLSEEQKQFYNANISLLESIKYNKTNMDVKRNKIVETIAVIDHLSPNISQTMYNSTMSDLYNFLAMTYLHGISEVGDSKNFNNIDHSISLFKKAIRLSSDVENKEFKMLVYSNLIYANNLKKDLDESKVYIDKVQELFSKLNYNAIYKSRIICNMTDYYEISKDVDQYNQYYKECMNSIESYKSDKQLIEKLVIENNKILTENNEEKSFSIYFKYGVIVFGLIVLICVVYYFLASKFNDVQIN